MNSPILGLPVESHINHDDIDIGNFESPAQAALHMKDNALIEKLDYAKTRSQMIFLTKSASRETINRAHYIDVVNNIKSSAEKEYETLMNEYKLKAREERDAKSRLMSQKDEYDRIIFEKDEEICQLRAKVELLKRKLQHSGTHVEAAEMKLQKFSHLQNVLQSMMAILDLSTPEDLVRRVKSLENTELLMLNQIGDLEDAKNNSETELSSLKSTMNLRTREFEEKLASSQHDIESLSKSLVLAQESQSSEINALRLLRDRHLTLSSYVSALWHYWRTHIDWGIIRSSPVVLLQDLKWRLIVRFGSVRDAFEASGVPKYCRVTRAQFQAHLAKLNVAPYESSSIFDFFVKGGGGNTADSVSKQIGPSVSVLMRGGAHTTQTASEQDSLAAEAQESEVRQLVTKAEIARKEQGIINGVTPSALGSSTSNGAIRESGNDGQYGNKISIKAVRAAVQERENLAAHQGGSNGSGTTIQMNIVYTAIENSVNYGPLHGLREKPNAEPLEILYESLKPDTSEPLHVLQAVQQLMILSHPSRGVAQLHEITQLTNSLYKMHFPESAQNGVAAEVFDLNNERRSPNNGKNKKNYPKFFQPAEIVKSVSEVMRLRKEEGEKSKNTAILLKRQLSNVLLSESKVTRALKLANEKNDLLASRIASLSGLPRHQIVDILLENGDRRHHSKNEETEIEENTNVSPKNIESTLNFKDMTLNSRKYDMNNSNSSFPASSVHMSPNFSQSPSHKPSTSLRRPASAVQLLRKQTNDNVGSGTVLTPPMNSSRMNTSPSFINIHEGNASKKSEITSNKRPQTAHPSSMRVSKSVANAIFNNKLN